MATSPVSRLHWLADELGAPVPVVVDTIFGGHGDEHDNPWHDAEQGRCDLDEAFGRRMAERFARHGVRFDLELFVSWVADAENFPEPVMVELVRELRAAGITTAMLTNSVREFRRVIERTVPLELFDHVIDSCEVGLRKPDHRIYALTASRLGLAPSACLFVDDLEVNVEGARSAGMVGLHLVDAATAAAEIRAAFGSAHPRHRGSP